MVNLSACLGFILSRKGVSGGARRPLRRNSAKTRRSSDLRAGARLRVRATVREWPARASLPVDANKASLLARRLPASEAPVTTHTAGKAALQHAGRPVRASFATQRHPKSLVASQPAHVGAGSRDAWDWSAGGAPAALRAKPEAMSFAFIACARSIYAGAPSG